MKLEELKNRLAAENIVLGLLKSRVAKNGRHRTFSEYMRRITAGISMILMNRAESSY